LLVNKTFRKKKHLNKYHKSNNINNIMDKNTLKTFNTNKIYSVNFFDSFNFNLKNNFFVTKDRDKFLLIKDYMRLIKKTVFNNNSIEQLYYDK
jgi:hypothetical protein